ncbi:hypothetical protein [Flavivirga algicola]|uniref:Uncharacterized protein n=1 Tax=Flavivirga algicola TaxID=2729136 RepID=A0ABX1RSM5_9FLAO|nr:hypothetical protein [Flavivirga algicola]NMH86552.1 hypothetical protein [Flavivirga algicola]
MKPFHHKKTVMLNSPKLKKTFSLKHLLVLSLLALLLMSFVTENVFNKQTTAISYKANNDLNKEKSYSLLREKRDVSHTKGRNTIIESDFAKTEFIIFKETTDEGLDKITANLKDLGYTISFKDLVRNDKGEIINLKIYLKNSSRSDIYSMGSSRPYPISPIVMILNCPHYRGKDIVTMLSKKNSIDLPLISHSTYLRISLQKDNSSKNVLHYEIGKYPRRIGTLLLQCFNVNTNRVMRKFKDHKETIFINGTKSTPYELGELSKKLKSNDIISNQKNYLEIREHKKTKNVFFYVDGIPRVFTLPPLVIVDGKEYKDFNFEGLIPENIKTLKSLKDKVVITTHEHALTNPKKQ